MSTAKRRTVHAEAILGPELHAQLPNTKVLLVGAGGIGCELRAPSISLFRKSLAHGDPETSQKHRVDWLWENHTVGPGYDRLVESQQTVLVQEKGCEAK